MAKWKTPPRKYQAMQLLRLRECVQITVFNFVVRLEARTPRLTGQLKNNWMTTLNSPSSAIIPGASESSTNTFSMAKAALDAYVLGDTIHIRNNLPYAGRIEFDGWSKVKAPAGMLRITVAELPQISRSAVLAVKAGNNGI